MPQVTEWDIWMRSTDVDGDGIVNNARYFEFFEQARLEHMAVLGLIRRPRPGEDGELQRPFTIAETTCRYRAPLRHRDWITVRCWTIEVRNRSFLFAYEIVMRDDRALVAEGTSAQVWLDAKGRPTAIADEQRQSLVTSSQ